MAMMISWVMPVNPSHPYLENDPAPSFAPTICAFHLGFSLGATHGNLDRYPGAAISASSSSALTANLGVNPTGPSVPKCTPFKQVDGWKQPCLQPWL